MIVGDEMDRPAQSGRMLRMAMLGLLLTLPVCGRASDVYCGIRSLHAAASAIGRKPDFSTLIDTQYVSTLAGSTMTDLQAAGATLGIAVDPIFGLGERSLRRTRFPLILHVSPRGISQSYFHWVAFLGMEGDSARVVDGPGGVHLMPLSQLMARWDGKALVVHEPQQPTALLWHKIMSLLLLCVLVAIALKAIDYIARGRKTTLPVSILSVLTLSVMVALPRSWNAVTDDLTRSVQQSIDASLGLLPLPAITLHELSSTPEDVILVDCRFKSDFDRGTIDEAVNLPIDSSYSDYRRFIADFASDSRVILFCQSKGCHFADYVASMLLGDGFNDLVIYRGGYQEWHSTNPATSQRRTVSPIDVKLVFRHGSGFNVPSPS